MYQILASIKYVCARRGVQRASEGCSSKAGPSWALACLADHEPPHLIRFNSEDVLPSLPALMYVRPLASVTLGKHAWSFRRYSSKALHAHEAGGLTYVRAQKFGEPKKPPKLLRVSGSALTNVVRPPLLVCVPKEFWQKPSPVTPPSYHSITIAVVIAVEPSIAVTVAVDPSIVIKFIAVAVAVAVEPSIVVEPSVAVK
jgi:hypothetical protein